MLALLLVGSTVAWLQTFRALEYEPRAILAAQQVASLVNLSRAALIHSDAIARVSLIKTLADQEALRILPREPGDRWDPFTQNDLDQRISDELARRLGPGTVVASRVNGTWSATIQAQWSPTGAFSANAALTSEQRMVYVMASKMNCSAGCTWSSTVIRRRARCPGKTPTGPRKR